jgi:redox-sensitive bicupin YhaK (pirin superfamily)
MKVSIRRSCDRGTAEHGWLHARFTFSFADYFDPNHIGFKSLQVMNNDIFEPHGGFPMHSHENAEIFTYILSGCLQHEDSMGNTSTITSGNLQYMSAGTGVSHSEFNPSSDTPCELYQIWMRPNIQGGSPTYTEKPLMTGSASSKLRLLFSGDGHSGSTKIRQNAEFYFGHLLPGQEQQLPISASLQNVWVQMISGQIEVFGETLQLADGLAIEDCLELPLIRASEESCFFVFLMCS